MKKFVIYFTILASLNCLSQNVLNETDSITVSFKKSLIEKNIDLFFSTKRYCHGCYGIEMNGCNTDGKVYFKTYIFWKDNNKNYWLKLIDNCGYYKKIKVSNTYMDFFIDNFSEIKSNQVKNYSIRDSNTGKINEVSRSHSFMERFKFHHKNDYFKTYIDYFDISNDRNENIYFDYKINLKIVRLSEMISELIDRIEKNNSFIRE